MLDNATLKLDSAVLKDCKFRSVFVGSLLASGQSRHAIITNSVVTDYQETRVFAVGPNSTLQMSYNKIIGSSPNALGITGILVVVGATGIITNNEVNENICDIPNNCGPEWFNQIQAFGIDTDSAAEVSVIANNYASNNEVGIGVFGGSVCCIVEQNKLKDNRFFGMIVGDSEHIVQDQNLWGTNWSSSYIHNWQYYYYTRPS